MLDKNLLSETHLITPLPHFSKETPDLETLEQHISQQDNRLVRVIDFALHKYAVEKYIVNSKELNLNSKSNLKYRPHQSVYSVNPLYLLFKI